MLSLFVQREGVTQPVCNFFFFSEEIVSDITVDSMCSREEMSSVAILNQNSVFAFRREFIFWSLSAKGRSQSPDDVHAVPLNVCVLFRNTTFGSMTVRSVTSVATSV